MMITMKKEETNRLKEFIINEEETLNEHEAVFYLPALGYMNNLRISEKIKNLALNGLKI